MRRDSHVRTGSRHDEAGCEDYCPSDVAEYCPSDVAEYCPSDVRREPRRFVAAAAALLLLAVGAPALAQDKPGKNKDIVVEANGLKYLRLDKQIQRISVGSVDIADVAPFPPNQLLVTGKRIGRTAVTVWYRDDEVETFPIVVGYPVDAIRETLAREIPRGDKIRVETAGQGLILAGVVPDAADVERAGLIVETFLHNFVEQGSSGQKEYLYTNLLTAGSEQQVQLEVSFAEVSRSALKQIGMNFWHKSTENAIAGGMLNPSQSLGSLVPDLSSQPAKDALVQNEGGLPIVSTPLGGTFGLLFSSGLDYAFPFSAALSVLSNRGYARTLAEPTLVAMSGEEATFLAGGEFPIPLPQALGQVVIEFKKFGIQLHFVPTVVRDTIQLRIAITVSDLDFSLGVKLASVTVPGLTERHSSTTVRLRDGQSFAIAGLLSDKVRSNVDKVPWLGDVPILGALFRSTSYRREETELLVVVTAHLVRPNDDRPELPGEDTRSDPSDLELFFVGSQESKEGGAVPHITPVHRTEGKEKEPAGPVGFRRSRGGSE